MVERCDRCDFFKGEVTEALFDLGKFNGVCLRRKTDTHVKKNDRCNRFQERIDCEKKMERY
jgi:hypothetical protein